MYDPLSLDLRPKIKTCCIALWVPKHGSVGRKRFFFFKLFFVALFGPIFFSFECFCVVFSRPLLADIFQFLML